MPTLRVLPRTAAPRQAPPAGSELPGLLDRFNTAVRRPSAHGGVEDLPLLLDALARAEGGEGGARWIPDAHARLNMAALLRHSFPQPEIHVVAAEFGAAAHERGWLRLDRTLTSPEYADLLGTTEDWAESDRTFDEVLRVYGPPSVVFGDGDPRAAKTLGYGSDDRTAPLAVFHFGPAEGTASAPLFAYRRGTGAFTASVGLTPLGEADPDEPEEHRS